MIWGSDGSLPFNTQQWPSQSR